MSTPFTDVYDYFLSQIDDFMMLEGDEDDALKYRYMLNSIPQFRKCPKLKDRTDSEFTEDLTDTEIAILGKLMVVEYYSPHINRLTLLKQAMSSRDFTLTSQANHLSTLVDIQIRLSREVKTMMMYYSYDNKDLSELR